MVMLPEQKAEEWKPIPGFEGIYDASSYGRIRSTPGKTTSNALYPIRIWKTRILKQKRQLSKRRKDARVSLWKDGIQKDYLVSRLVASAWFGEHNNMTVNHINGDYTDNRPENLEWTTLSDNIKHGYLTGLYDSVLKPVILVNNGSELHFKSMSEASLFLHRNKGYISNSLKHNRNIVTSTDGIEYMVKK